MWNAAKATSKFDFEKELKKLNQLNKVTHNRLIAIPTKYWTNHARSAHFKCDMLLNNISESFNSYIMEGRRKSILSMFEMIRKNL